MEETHLDYNQPFLSVRRFTSTVSSEKKEKTKTVKKHPAISSLPYYKSDLKSGPVSNPGTVPFVWEKFPGRPKYEDEPMSLSLEQPPVAPRLPPGRRMREKEQALDKVSESSSPTSCESRRFVSVSLSYSSLNEISTKIEASRDELEDRESFVSCDNDDAYQDALDTLSRTESFFVNCSLSGLSCLDDLEEKPSRTLSTDPQTKDFMMGRFLPAAKAMTCDSPHSSYKKPTFVSKDVMGGSKRPPVYPSKPKIAPKYDEIYIIEDESEDDDDDDHENRNLSTRGCGLLPRFCRLSPVPGFSVRMRASIKPSASQRQVKSLFATSNQEKEKEGSGSFNQEQRSIEPNQCPELCESKQSTENNDQKLDGRSLYSRLQRNGLPILDNKLPQSRFYKEIEVVKIDSFNSEKRCVNNFEELTTHQGTERDIRYATPTSEKTLYIDSLHKVAPPEIKSFSVNDDVESLGVTKTEETEFDNSVCKDIEGSKIMEKNGICENKSLNSLELLSRNLKVQNNDYLNTESKQKIIKVENTKNSINMDMNFLIPPPLPKSPSESWLCRTLPSMSSKNPSSRSFPGNKVNYQNQGSKVSSGDLKWEAIVKSTKV